MKKNKTKKNQSVLKKLLHMMFAHDKRRLFIVVFCIVFSAIAQLATSVFLQLIIDNCIVPSLGAQTTEYLGTLAFYLSLMAGIFATGLISSFFSTRLMAVICQSFLMHLRTKMFVKMQSLPIKYFDSNTHGDIMSHYTNDIDTLRQFVSQSMPQLLSSVISITSFVFLMLYYSIYLSIVVFISVIVMILVTKKIGGMSAKYFLKQQQSIAKTEGFIEEMIHGQKVIKVFCHENETKKDFKKINDGLFHDVESAHKFANVLMPMMGNIGNIMYVLLAFVGSTLVLMKIDNFALTGFNPLTVGVIISFLTMGRTFSNTIAQLSQQINAIVMALAGGKRIFALLEEEKEVDDGYVTLVNAIVSSNGEITESESRTGVWAWKHPHAAENTVSYTLLKGNITLNDVDFGYTKEKLVLKNVSVYANAGQNVAFVGSTGAGKTTITNLINRFYDIADGKIRYDGININKIKKADLRHSLGIVLQETNLFTGTVIDNIRYGALDATEEECIAAAKLANAHDFIERLPEGYQTLLIADGANLSQGQRQLLSIARAAVCNAPVLILDEATSSIDTRTEKLVQEGTDKLMAGRTVFVIAHRLSTIQNADVIMVLDHGSIIERGSHKELINKKGQYYQLYTGAFELE